MGKYMKKSKITGDVAVMEVSPQTTLGVRTRAKTLALQRLQKSDSAAVSPAAAQNPDASSFSYLQLRSRRLEKSLPPIPKKQQLSKEASKVCPNPSPSSKAGSRLRASSVSSGSAGCEKKGEDDENRKHENGKKQGEMEDFEAFGENNLDAEARDRSTRESTPCSLIRDPDAIGTPGSTTRRTGTAGANRRIQNDVQRRVPTAREMEEFFSSAEKQQQKLFTEKYNFDIVNDLPLPGRYEWVRVTP